MSQSAGCVVGGSEVGGTVVGSVVGVVVGGVVVGAGIEGSIVGSVVVGITTGGVVVGPTAAPVVVGPPPTAGAVVGVMCTMPFGSTETPTDGALVAGVAASRVEPSDRCSTCFDGTPGA